MQDLKIEFTGGFAIFNILIIALFCLYWCAVIWSCIFGGGFDLSFSSKGMFPQIRAFLKHRKEHQQKIKELRERISQAQEDLH